jgi:hypothetical protein
MLKKIAVGVISLFLLLAAQVADACVEIAFLQAPVSMNYPILLPTGSPVFANPRIGIYQWQDVTGVYIYEAFCIDLETTGEGGPIAYDCVELTEARDVSLTGGQLSEFRADLLELLWGQFRWSVVGVDEAAAFQLAISSRGTRTRGRTRSSKGISTPYRSSKRPGVRSRTCTGNAASGSSVEICPSLFSNADDGVILGSDGAMVYCRRK